MMSAWTQGRQRTRYNNKIMPGSCVWRREDTTNKKNTYTHAHTVALNSFYLFE